DHHTTSPDTGINRNPRMPLDNHQTTQPQPHPTTHTPPHEPETTPQTSNQQPPYRIQRTLAAWLDFKPNSIRLGKIAREAVHKVGIDVFKVLRENAEALPSLSIEIVGHSNGMQAGIPHHGFAKERGLERANVVAGYLRKFLFSYAEFLKNQGISSFDPGFIQITPRTAGDNLPDGSSLDENPYAARRRVVILVSKPFVFEIASLKHDKAVEASSAAHFLSQEEINTEAELRHLKDEIRTEFGIRLDSEEGARVAIESNRVTDPVVMAEIRPVPWTVRGVQGIIAALKHYKPILGRNRNTSSRSGIEQEVNIIGNITWLLGASETHDIKSSVVGEYAYKYKTFNLATYAYKNSERFQQTVTHELAHGLLRYAEQQFENEFWAGHQRPSATTQIQDFVNAISDYIQHPMQLKEVAPRYAAGMASLDAHEPGVLTILPGENIHDAVRRIVAQLGGYLPQFMQHMGTWTEDGRPSIFFLRERPITKYGETNFKEDLADTAAVYFTDIQRLKAGAPLRAEFMDRLVEGWKQRREADVSEGANQNDVTTDQVLLSQRRQSDGGTAEYRTRSDRFSAELFPEVRGRRTQHDEATDSLNLRDLGAEQQSQPAFPSKATEHPLIQQQIRQEVNLLHIVEGSREPVPAVHGTSEPTATDSHKDEVPIGSAPYPASVKGKEKGATPDSELPLSGMEEKLDVNNLEE
ncbi:hypothetical protein, partial [Streptomyces sp. NPDC094468]|uniref:hypothetical protein n=1 Tax=Streptomyces sp. NPDC094468 TaxID=3366066 RepID=UPI003801B0AA